MLLVCLENSVTALCRQLVSALSRGWTRHLQRFTLNLFSKCNKEKTWISECLSYCLNGEGMSYKRTYWSSSCQKKNILCHWAFRNLGVSTQKSYLKLWIGAAVEELWWRGGIAVSLTVQLVNVIMENWQWHVRFSSAGKIKTFKKRNLIWSEWEWKVCPHLY